MFLVVHAESLAPGIPADLVAGRFVAGAACLVTLASHERLAADVTSCDGDGSVVLAVDGDLWRLVRGSRGEAGLLTAGDPPPVQGWLFDRRLGAADEATRQGSPVSCAASFGPDDA